MAGYPGATVSWLAVSAVLAGIVALEISENVPLAPTVTAAPVETVLAEPVDLDFSVMAALSSDLLDDIVERPLFSTSRRPFEPVIEEQPQVVSAPNWQLSLQLVGTMLSDSSKIVLLKHPANGLLRLRQGQVVEGWEIGEIGNNLVELRRGDEVAWLRLRADLLLPAGQGPKTSNHQPDGPDNLPEEAAAMSPGTTTGEPQPKKE